MHVSIFIQLRKRLSEATEKQQKAEHEREVTEMKVLEVREQERSVCGGGGGGCPRHSE